MLLLRTVLVRRLCVDWLIKYREANGGTEADLTVSERARLKELEREVQDLRAETAFLKKASAYFAREQR